jgi:hypothetical protein
VGSTARLSDGFPAILRGAFQFGEDHGSWAKAFRKPQTFKEGCVMVRGASLAPFNYRRILNAVPYAPDLAHGEGATSSA